NLTKSALFFALLAAGFQSVQAQEKEQVKGATQQESGAFLSGVSIKAVHQTSGRTFTTSSGERGLFSFNGLPEGGPYQFIFTSVGLQQDTMAGYTIQAGQQLALSVKLQGKAAALEEVGIGYWMVARKHGTSSITTVKAEDVIVGVVTSPARMVQGIFPGDTIS